MINAKDAVSVLNELLGQDYGAISSLVNNRVDCSDSFAHDSNAMCSKPKGAHNFQIGMLGVINAMTTGGYAAAEIENDRIVKFVVVGGDK
ncbi:hypothetical protein vBYenSP400_27 [Yersinia phage vB_YenS_P400]|nr:hypothetical protein vBYenSP400_27 [Yersinia phage vB_YenS_P400]